IIITITWYFWTTGNGSGWECRGSTIQRSRRRRKPSGFRNSSGEETLQWSWKKKSGKKTTDSDTGAGVSGGRGRESSVSMREKIQRKNRKKRKNIGGRRSGRQRKPMRWEKCLSAASSFIRIRSSDGDITGEQWIRIRWRMQR